MGKNNFQGAARLFAEKIMEAGPAGAGKIQAALALNQ
jgi:hypothetical protein